MKRALLLTGTILLLLLSAFLVSCAQSPEQNPIIQELIQKVADLSEKTDQITSKTKDLENDIDSISQDLTTLKQMPQTQGANPAEVEAIKTQIKDLTTEITKVKSDFAQVSKDIEAAKKIAASRVSEAPRSAAEAAPRAASRPEPAPEPKVRGQFYTAKQGDTVESIAREFNTTVQAVKDSNPTLKQSDRIVPGNKYWIVKN